MNAINFIINVNVKVKIYTKTQFRYYVNKQNILISIFNENLYFN